MLDWLFGTPENSYYREVYVISSRHRTRVFKVYGDTPVCEIRALKEVEAKLDPAEEGETIQIKTKLGNR